MRANSWVATLEYTCIRTLCLHFECRQRHSSRVGNLWTSTSLHRDRRTCGHCRRGLLVFVCWDLSELAKLWAITPFLIRASTFPLWNHGEFWASSDLPTTPYPIYINNFIQLWFQINCNKHENVPLSEMIFFPVNFLMASQVIGLPGSILTLSAKCPPPLVWIKSIFLESLKKLHHLFMSSHGLMSHDIKALGNWPLIDLTISSKSFLESSPDKPPPKIEIENKRAVQK